MIPVDVVVVTYNSRDCLRGCVEPFVGVRGVSVTVVDNACPEKSYEVVEDIPVRVLHMARNGGFSYGCNAGWRSGSADYVLFLNPDAVLGVEDLERLSDELRSDPSTAIVGPRTLNDDGVVEFTIRRFPTLVSTYAQALFLHSLAPYARWVDEVVRDPAAYSRRAGVDWLSGSCLLVRRSALEAVGGLDETFFFYAEDVDLCKRVQQETRLHVVYTPTATCLHVGQGVPAPARILPMLASSRLHYARQHRGRIGALLERVGLGLGEALHSLAGYGDRHWRVGHLRALGVIVRGDEAHRPG